MLGSSWKALLATTNRQVGGSDWVLKPNKKYYRKAIDVNTPYGLLIGNTNSNSWFTFNTTNLFHKVMFKLFNYVFNYSLTHHLNFKSKFTNYLFLFK